MAKELKKEEPKVEVKAVKPEVAKEFVDYINGKDFVFVPREQVVIK